MLRALVVGAGAVGQVFGYHLWKGGAEVSFLVKPKYVEECKRGFTLYHLPHVTPIRFAAEIVTELAGAYDQIYITVASNALRSGSVDNVLAQSGHATLVMLQPGLGDHAYVAARAAEDRIVDGSINFLSYHAPLPGETRFSEPGMAYWWFPGKCPFSGPHAEAVVEALRAGELPAKRVDNVPAQVAFPSAILSGFIGGLEAAQWSFDTMRAAGLAKLGAHAAAEALRVTGHELGKRPPLAMRLAARPLAFRSILRIAPQVVPVDLQAYLQAHFTKVAAQMHDHLRDYVARGRAAGITVDALEQLHNRCTT